VAIKGKVGAKIKSNSNFSGRYLERTVGDYDRVQQGEGRHKAPERRKRGERGRKDKKGEMPSAKFSEENKKR